MSAPPATAHWTPPDAKYHDRRWWLLVVLCTSLVIVVVGNTALNTAIPTIQRDLHATQTQLQWMVDAYSLVFAGLLLSAGAMGDRFGRKGALQLGLVIFGGGSLMAGLVHSANAVIAFRALMGVGAAFIMPGTLSILANVFSPQERPKAIAIWAGLSGAGGAIGPIASGYLLDHFSYGSVFFVNLPIIAIALVAGYLLLPTSKDPEQGRLDPIGAVLSIVGLVAIVYAIIEAPDHGWLSARTIGVAAFGLVVMVAFALWELRSDHPMLDLNFFRNPRFSMASGGITLIFFTMFGMFFLITQYFQLVLGYSPFGAGLRQLPVAVALMAVAPRSATLVARFGPKRVVAAGLFLVGVGQLLIGGSQVHSPYWYIAVSMMVTASGMGLGMAPLTASIMGSIPQGKAGVGSAVNDTTRELGGALGVAVLGSLLQSAYAARITVAGVPAPMLSASKKTIGAALAVSRQLAANGQGDTAKALADQAKEAYVHGMRLAVLVGATVVFIAAGLVLRFLPGKAMAGFAAAPDAGEGVRAAGAVEPEPA